LNSRLFSFTRLSVASLTTCLGLAASQGAQATLNITDAPHLEGSFSPDAATDLDVLSVDFDQDGLIEFNIIYNGQFEIADSENDQNPDFLPISSSGGGTPANISFNLIVFDSPEEAFEGAVDAFRLPFQLTGFSADIPEDDFPLGDPGFLSVIFTGGDGQEYVGFLGIEVFDSVSFEDAELIISDAGFIAVPEPSSLALLGLGGLIAVRRRRG